MNGFFDGAAFRPGPGIHLGVAISLREGGLIVPALHDVDAKPLDVLGRELVDLLERARRGQLRSSELADATMTVTSLGERGVEQVFGVIFPPQVAIVGIGKVVERAVGGGRAVRRAADADLHPRRGPPGQRRPPRRAVPRRGRRAAAEAGGAVTRDELRQVVLEEIGKLAPEAELEGLAPKTRLREELDLDSFDFVTLVTALDRRLGVDVPEVDYRKLETLEGCLDYLAEHLTPAKA